MDRSDYPSMDESFREIKPTNQLITVSITISYSRATLFYCAVLVWLIYRHFGGEGGELECMFY